MYKNYIWWLIFSATIFTSCFSTSTNYTCALYDITDEHMADLTYEELYASIITTGGVWDGHKFTYGVISDIEYNPEVILSLPSEVSWFGNEFKRKAKIKQFAVDLKSITDSMKKDERQYSIIFPTIVRTVNQLAKKVSTGKKSILIFSDLMENAPGLSFHKMPIHQLNKVKANRLLDKLVKHYNIDLADNLEGIEVKFVYKARNYSDSRRFSNLVNMYRNVLEKRDATVVVAANLNRHG